MGSRHGKIKKERFLPVFPHFFQDLIRQLIQDLFLFKAPEPLGPFPEKSLSRALCHMIRQRRKMIIFYIDIGRSYPGKR